MVPLEADLNSSDYYFQDAVGSSDSEDDMDPEEEPIEVETSVVASVVLARPKTPVSVPLEHQSSENGVEYDESLTLPEITPTLIDSDFPGYPSDGEQENPASELTAVSPAESSAQPGIWSRVTSFIWPFSSKSSPTTSSNPTSGPQSPSTSSPSTDLPSNAPDTSKPTPTSSTSSSIATTHPKTSPSSSTPQPPSPKTVTVDTPSGVHYHFHLNGITDPAVMRDILRGALHPGAAGAAGAPVGAIAQPMIGGGPPPPPPPVGGPLPPPMPALSPALSGPSATKKPSYAEERDAKAKAKARSDFVEGITEAIRAATKTRPENQDLAITHWIEVYDKSPVRADLLLKFYGKLFVAHPSRFDLIDGIFDYWEESLYNQAVKQHNLDDTIINQIRTKTAAKLVLTELEWVHEGVSPEKHAELRAAELKRQQTAIQRIVDDANIQGERKDLVQQLNAAFAKRRILHPEDDKEEEEEAGYDD